MVAAVAWGEVPAARGSAGNARHPFRGGRRRAGARFRHSPRKFAPSGRRSDVLRMFTVGGAAVAVGDYDGDGFDDLFVTDSARARRATSTTTKAGRLRPRHFTDVAEQAGVAGGNDPRSIVADALWFDYDNDGRRRPARRPLRHADPLPQPGGRQSSRTSRPPRGSPSSATRSPPSPSTTTTTGGSTCSSATTSSPTTCST